MHSLPFVILRRDTFLSSFRAKRSEDPEPSGAEGDLFTQECRLSASATGSRSRAPLGPPVCAAKTRLAGG